ncbi:MAG: hypothetical protein WCF19_01555 [Chlamydiales bacterium]
MAQPLRQAFQSFETNYFQYLHDKKQNTGELHHRFMIKNNEDEGRLYDVVHVVIYGANYNICQFIGDAPEAKQFIWKVRIEGPAQLIASKTILNEIEGELRSEALSVQRADLCEQNGRAPIVTATFVIFFSLDHQEMDSSGKEEDVSVSSPQSPWE